MVSELDKLESAARDFELEADPDYVDPSRLAAVIDRLQGKLCKVVDRARRRGDQLVNGHYSAVSFVMSACNLSQGSASDRLCVGRHLESMPKVAEALSNGEIGYQSASVICHLRDRLGEQADCLDEEQWIRYARENSIKSLGQLSDHMRYVIDPDGFDKETEENYEERFLHISEMNGMYHLDGVIDPEGGAVLKSAVDALAKRLGQDDGRTSKQRRADALTEIVYHAMEAARWPGATGRGRTSQ